MMWVMTRWLAKNSWLLALWLMSEPLLAQAPKKASPAPAAKPAVTAKPAAAKVKAPAKKAALAAPKAKAKKAVAAPKKASPAAAAKPVVVKRQFEAKKTEIIPKAPLETKLTKQQQMLQSTPPEKVSDKKRAEENNERFLKALASVKNRYKGGELNNRDVWNNLAKLFDLFSDGVGLNPSELLQAQAQMLYEAGFPFLSAKYASWSILTARDPYAYDVEASWRLLNNIARKRQIHDILIHLARNIGYQGKLPPIFGDDWYYFIAEAMERLGKDEEARATYAKVGPDQRYYLAARYQLGVSYYLNGMYEKSVATLKEITDPKTPIKSDIPGMRKRQYEDYAYSALGRVFYEKENYLASINNYRKVSRTSPIFYDALFEQSWAFFLAGYPNHSLGALHSADSPFFPGRFNPEISILRTMNYYWMCRYDDARTALAEFIEQYADPITELGRFLDRKNLKSDTAYQLFENLITGVSSESLGISRDLLESVSRSDRMKYARDRLATVVKERDQLDAKGIFGSKQHISFPQKMLAEWVDELQQDLGSVYIVELEALRDQFRDLRSQADFLYIELLMSEKEQVMGRELHAAAKMDKVSQKLKVKGWGQASVPWRGSTLGEYWWDEIGFYIYQVEPRCKGEVEE